MQILCGEIQQISQGGNVRKLNRIMLVPIYLLSITVNSCQFVTFLLMLFDHSKT